MVVMGLAAIDKHLRSVKECVTIGTALKSLLFKFKFLKDDILLAISGDTVGKALYASDKVTRLGVGKMGT